MFAGKKTMTAHHLEGWIVGLLTVAGVLILFLFVEQLVFWIRGRNTKRRHGAIIKNMRDWEDWK